VTFHGYGPDGTLGYVADGELFLAPPGGTPARVPGVAGATSFELAGPGAGLAALVRRRAASGGELLAVPARSPDGPAPAVPVAARVGDYGFGRGRHYAFTRMDRDGARLELAEASPAVRSTPLAKAVRVFAFAPQGEGLAYVADAAPGKQGNLRLRVGERELELGAREVGEFRWAARGLRLAWLEGYDPRVRSGTVGAGGPELPRRTFGKNVSDFEISPDGRFVAFLQHSTRGGYSIDLLLADLEAPATAPPRPVAQSSFGFSFSPDGRWLYYRTRCARDGAACDLERLEAAVPAARAELVAEGVKSFEFAPGAPGRLLLSWKPLGREALDLAVWERGRIVTVDTFVLPGSARFLAPDSRRLAYVVVREKRAGVYVADLPAAP
jgi:dipeptidyl aminopeptidase/acylaminoacyl peptidase